MSALLAPDTEYDEPLEFTPYEFTQMTVNHKGAPIELQNRPWLYHIYNLPFSPMKSQMAREVEREVWRRRVLLVFGRQSEKSTTLGNLLLSTSNLIPYLRSLYVTASNSQMLEFSDERLRAVIDDSPYLAELASGEVQNVMTKRWAGQSKINLRSVYKGPDRARGIMCDHLVIDELQDVYLDGLPVIEETTRACAFVEGDLKVYAGTPKTYDNSIEHYWSRRSTQNEWMIRCSRCRHWNVVEIENVRPAGLCCSKCDRELDPVNHGTWVRHGSAESEWEGFRVPQPIVEYVYRSNPAIFWRKWETLLHKIKNYPRGQLQNEVFARSHDSGSKPVTFQQVRRCALPDLKFIDQPTSMFRQSPKWAGVDWGTGDGSFTVLSIWGYDAYGRFRCYFAKKYVGYESDPEYATADIIKTCRAFGVNRIGADWGFGFETNRTIMKQFGAERFHQYQHTDGQAKLVKYDAERNVYTTHRSRVLELVFELIRRGPVSQGICFPNWDHFEPFANDILSVYSEYSRLRRQIVYDHPRTQPDDFLHTMIYALLASLNDVRRPDLITPAA
jgi:hypothetical protein